jgi:hypothetical protein
MKNLGSQPRLFAAGWRGVFLGLYRPERQAIVDRDGDKRDQADGDDCMHDQHQPMPGRRVGALRLALDQDTIFVFFADDLGHRLSLMISDRGLGRVESRPGG